jgi:hypothetical protein
MRKLAILLFAATGVFAGEKGALSIYVSPEHPYSLAMRDVWTSGTSDGEGVDLALQHRSGKAAAVLSVLHGAMTLEDLRESALRTGREVSPDLEVVSESRTTKDGAELLTMYMTGTTADGPVAYRGVYWAGAGKQIQLVARTTKETDGDVVELLDGLRIRVEKRAPQDQRAFTWDFTPMKWRVTSDGTGDGTMMLAHVAGDVIALASASRVELAPAGLRAHVLEKTKAIGPGARFVSESAKVVNGTKLTVLQYDGISLNGEKAVLLGYFFAGNGVIVEAIAVASQAGFAGRRADMVELLDGLHVHIAQ